MKHRLNVLLLEDREDDAFLVIHALQQSGYDPKWQRVDDKNAYYQALSNRPDLILADYSLPQFTALEALKILQELALDIPFIVVTGTLEEAALACMKEGAADYLLKDRLSRLGEAVKRALEERHLRQERAQALADLRSSEERFRRLAENAPDIIFRFAVEQNKTPSLQFINRAVFDVTGYKPDEFYADKTLFWRVVYPDDVHVLEDFFTLKELERVIEHRFIHRNGKIHWIQNRAVPIFDDNNEIIAVEGVSRDITERWLAEQAEQEQRKLAEALRDTATILNSSLTLDKVFDGILKNVERVVPHDGANIMLVKDGGEAHVVACYGYYLENDLSERVLAMRFTIDQALNLRTMMETKRPYIVPFTQEDPYWQRLPPTNWVCSYVSAPIQRDGNVIGFLNLDSQTPGFFNESHVGRLQAFADQVAIAIRNAQLYETEQYQRRIEETLREAAAVLNESLRLEEVFSRILDQLAQAIEFDSGSVQQVDGDKLVLKAVTGFRHHASLLDIKIPITSDHPNQEVLVSHQAVSIPDVTLTHEGFNRIIKTYQTHGIHSWLGVPMNVQGQVIGMITLDRHEVRPFTTAEIDIATTFANHAATALQNAKLYEELEFYNEQLEQAVLERTNEMRRAMQEAETILNNSPDAILLLSADGTVKTCNPAFYEMFGYQPTEITETAPTGFIINKHRLAMSSLLARAKENLQTERAELIAQRKDKSQFDIEVALSPIANRDVGSGIVCTMRDISALKKVERMKDAFIANVSHELRTPITNLRLHSDLLKRNPRNREKYTDRIHREAMRLGLIVEDLLRLARLEQGQITLKQTTFQLNELVQEYAEDRLSLAEEEELSFKLKLASDLEPIVADPGLIGQVLSILLTNAINYTPPQGVITIATQQLMEGDFLWQEISVKDTGPGISPEDFHNLFVRFYRGEAGRTSGKPGTGLGLAIVKEIIERHNGRIQVQSDGLPGHGATFNIQIPVTQPDPSE